VKSNVKSLNADNQDWSFEKRHSIWLEQETLECGALLREDSHARYRLRFGFSRRLAEDIALSRKHREAESASDRVDQAKIQSAPIFWSSESVVEGAHSKRFRRSSISSTTLTIILRNCRIAHPAPKRCLGSKLGFFSNEITRLSVIVNERLLRERAGKPPLKSTVFLISSLNRRGTGVLSFLNKPSGSGDCHKAEQEG
jgi:hypothetical protein